MLRLFTALPIPWDVAEVLKRRQTGLPGARWRPGEALHVTLAGDHLFGPAGAALRPEARGGLLEIAAQRFAV